MVSTTSFAGRISWIRPTPCPASQGISSQSPSVSAVGSSTLNLRISVSCPRNIVRPITGRPSRTVGTSARRSVHSSTTRLRRSRIGLKCGHSGPKIDERTVCSPLPSTRRRLCSEWTAASSVATSRLPTQTSSAWQTTNRDVFSASPLDPASGASLGQLLHPSQHLLFGCFTSPMQSLTASYNSPLDDLRVGGSKEDGPPNHTICAVDHCVPPSGKALQPYGPQPLSQ